MQLDLLTHEKIKKWEEENSFLAGVLQRESLTYEHYISEILYDIELNEKKLQVEKAHQLVINKDGKMESTEDLIMPYVDLTDLLPENIRTDRDLIDFLTEFSEQGYAFETDDNKYIGIERNKNKIRHLAIGKKFSNSQESRRLKENRNKYLNVIEKIINNAVESKAPEENTKKDKKPDVEKYHYFRSYVKLDDKYFELRLDTEEKTGKKIGEMPAPVYISKKRMTNGKLNSPHNISPKNGEMPALVFYIPKKRRTDWKLNSTQNISPENNDISNLEQKSIPLYLYDIFETKLSMQYPEEYLKNKMYRDAVIGGNIEKAKKILLQEARLNGYQITPENKEELSKITYDENGFLVPLSKHFDKSRFENKLEDNKSKENYMEKQKIDVNTYKFQSGQTIDEILENQTSWENDQECLLNMIDSSIREVSDFANEKEKEALKKISAVSQLPDTDLKLLAVQADVATRYMAVKHFDQNAMDRGERPYLTNVVNVSAQDDFSYELPSWLKGDLEEYPEINNNEFENKRDKEFEEAFPVLDQKTSRRIDNGEIFTTYESMETIAVKNEVIDENKIFQYKNYNFYPVRDFTEDEKEFIFSNAEKKNYKKNSLLRNLNNPFNKADFDKISSADINYCFETGSFYYSQNDGIYSLNNENMQNHFTDEIVKFRKSNFQFINIFKKVNFNENSKEIMAKINEVLTDGEVFTMQNETLGDVRIRRGSLDQNCNLLHTITHRMSERVKRDKADMKLSQKETAAIIFLMTSNLNKAPAVEENNGNFAVYANGIKTVIGNDKYGRFVVTGYNFEGTKEEAMDSISTVIAQYGYTQEFLGIYAQVGAIASLSEIIPQLNNNSNNFVYHDTKIDVQSFSENGQTGHQLIEPAFNHCFTKIESDSPEYRADGDYTEYLDSKARENEFCIQNKSDNYLPAIAAEIIEQDKEVHNQSVNKQFVEKVKELKEKVTKQIKKGIVTAVAIGSVLSASPDLFAKSKAAAPDNSFSKEQQKIIQQADKEYNELMTKADSLSKEELIKLLSKAYEEKKNVSLHYADEIQKNKETQEQIDSLRAENKKLAEEINDKNIAISVKDKRIEMLKVESGAKDSFYKDMKDMEAKYYTLQKSAEQNHKILYEHTKIVVNGKERECSTGLVNGFKTCVSRLDDQLKLNKSLTFENEQLRNSLYRANQNSRNGVSY